MSTNWEDLLTRARTDLRWKPGKDRPPVTFPLRRWPPEVAEVVATWTALDEDAVKALGGRPVDGVRSEASNVRGDFELVTGKDGAERLRRTTRTARKLPARGTWASETQLADLHAQAVVIAVLLRSVDKISPEAFAELTSGWREAGLAIPDRR